MPSFASVPMLWGQAAADAADTGMSLGASAAIIIAVIVGSFLLGQVLANWLRMPEYNLKIGLVLATLLGAIAIDILLWPPKLGIDLSGGVVLVYEIDESQMQESNRGQLLEKLNQQLGTVEGQKLKARLNADRQVEILLPNSAAGPKAVQAVERLNEGLTEVGPRTVDGKPVLVYELPKRERKPDLMQKLVGAVSKRINPSGVKEVTIRQYGAQQIEIIVPEVEQREVEQIKRIISTSGNLQFRILANSKEADHKEIIDLALESPADEVYQGAKLKGRWIGMRKGVNPQNAVFRKGPRGVDQVLVLIDDYNVDGDYLSGAAPGVDEHGGICITFSFDNRGALKFGQLTGDNLPNKATGLAHELGIVLDNELQSAASIRSTIRDRGQITGSFDEDYVNFVVNVLNSGSLPAALQKVPISEQAIGAQLGADTIKSGTDAMIISTIAVVAFMLFYYRFAGIVADVAVIMNMILAVALMMLIKAAFTLPGLAGLVLTVGMAVDANVLIYERMREEAAKGASLRMTIRNGFTRAMATIIDSHLTTVSTAVVLFAIGTDQIKGFAISLILGLAVSLYTAVYVARVIFDIFERKRWLTRLHMRQFIGETHIDFVRWRGPAIAASLVVIGIGMVGVYFRGSGLLDIDFSGGTSVQLLFDKNHPQDVAKVRSVASNLEDLEDVSVSSVGKNNIEFKIDTSQPDMKLVQQRLKTAFQGELATYSMTYEEPKAARSPRSLSGGTSTQGTSPKSTSPKSTAPVSKEPVSKEPASTPPATPQSAPPAETPKSTDGSAPADDAKATPAAETPASDAAAPGKDSPAGGAKPAASPAPEGKPAPKGARHLGGRDATMLALADDVPAALDGLLLAQDTGSAKAPDQTSTPDQPAAKPAEPPAATADAPAEPAARPEPPAKPATPADTSAISAPGPEVAGATEVQLHFTEKINRPTLAKLVDENLAEAKLPVVKYSLSNPDATVQDNHAYSDWKLSIDLSPDETRPLLEQMQSRLADLPVFPSSSVIGAKVAGDTQYLALEALLASMVMIVLYLWVRFQNIMFGFAAVLALIHDVLITVGFLALSYWLAPYFGWRWSIRSRSAWRSSRRC